MKRPRLPPSFPGLLERFRRDNRLEQVLRAAAETAPPGKYLHWDKLRFHEPPVGLSLEEWWAVLKLNRRAQYRCVPLRDLDGAPFNYALPDPAPERLHEIDLRLGGAVGMPAAITSPNTKDQYLARSLIEEAVTSSQMEGATTPRKVAKAMIRLGRRPRDQGERMILNNYRMMQRLIDWKDKPLTRELICEVQRLLTLGTLPDPSDAGRFRNGGGQVVVGDDYGEVFHVPPPAVQLNGRMAAMCEFANDTSRQQFVHPVIRSMILHFWLAYDHPFVDGNGRTARALFYWSMLQHGYRPCEFISISEIILKAPARYGRAFQYTETDDNDLTYFLLYHLDVLEHAIERLDAYVARKTKRLQDLERGLRGVKTLNHRQRALIGDAAGHPNNRYTIESHRSSHGVVHQTARTDLLDLEERGLFRKEKVGRVWHFIPVVDLERRLAEWS